MGGFTVNFEDYHSRNKFLSFFLMVWGLFNFACTLNIVVDNEQSQDEMWCAASFFVMLAAFVNLVLLSMESYDRIAKYITIALLVLGFLLTIVGGAVTVDETCNDSENCGLLEFGQRVLLPALLCLVLAVDLYGQYCNNARTRIIVFSCLLFLVAVLVCAAYFDMDQDSLSDEEKCTEAGMLLISIACAIILIVHGAIAKTSIAFLNAFVALLLWLGTFLLLANDGICQTTYMSWYMVLLSVVYLLSSDAQAGGTIKLNVGQKS